MLKAFEKQKKGKKVKKKDTKKQILFSSFGMGKEKDYFIGNLSLLVGSGMGILPALKAIKADLHSKKMRQVLDELEERVEAGFPLWYALDKIGIFSAHIISLVRVGEEAGKLYENLGVIAAEEEKQRMFRSRVQSAMVYPVLVLALTIIIGICVAWFILPRLAFVFSQLKLELPVITRAIIAVGKFLESYGSIAIPISFLVTVGIIYFFFYHPQTKSLGQKLLFYFPGLRNLIQQIELARLGFLLGTLLKAGLPVTVALNSLCQATTFPVYKKFYTYLYNSVEEGNSFQKSFSLYPRVRTLIPTPVQHMIISGEQSGNLAEVLLKIGKDFEDKIEVTTKNLTVVLEPTLLIIVWIGVVVVAVAVILPIYSLIGGLNRISSPPSLPTPPLRESLKGEELPLVTEFPLMSTSTSTEDKTEKSETLPTLKILPTGTGFLNVRNEPVLTGEIVAQVKPGEIYKYSDEENGWYEILLEGEREEGWILGKYIELLDEVTPLVATSTISDTSSQPSLPQLKILPTVTNYLNVRDRPSLGGAVITRVTPGETYAYTDEEVGWYKIILLNERSGWVSGKYVELIFNQSVPGSQEPND